MQFNMQNRMIFNISLIFQKASVSGLKSSYQYTGKALTPAVTVKMGKQVLRKEKDYQVVYRNNKNTGTATVTITGLGNYEGTIKKTFKIVKASSAKKNIQKMLCWTDCRPEVYRKIFKTNCYCKRRIKKTEKRNRLYIDI